MPPLPPLPPFRVRPTGVRCAAFHPFVCPTAEIAAMCETASRVRNVAIVAHVDHGKTTLVDKLLQQSGTLSQRGTDIERIMDSNDLERERGITILSKNTAIKWENCRINIVDTPGHADFGGEVERALSMVDSVLLLVDAVDGPMPQTTFVTKKALNRGLKPIVVVNKVDRPSARPDWVVDQTFDLFDRLGASDDQLDFPVVFASALEGWAIMDKEDRRVDLTPLLNVIINCVPAPDVDIDGPLQLQVSALDYSSYVGVIGIGRINRGRLLRNSSIAVAGTDGSVRRSRVLQVFGFHGLERIEQDEAKAGDIVAFTGAGDVKISETLADLDAVEALPSLIVDEPTIGMTFQVNDSPLGGKEGKFVTSRVLKERLDQELLHNVALRVEETSSADKFRVSGRGELHLSILIENMRREGYELAISRPEVILQEIDGQVCEPWETLAVDIDEANQGAVMEKLGERRGELTAMVPDGQGRVRLDYRIPSRGLIGFRPEFMTITSGRGVIYHSFDVYGPRVTGDLGRRKQGALVSMASGKASAYSLFNLQERGRLFIKDGEEVYEGMVIGMNSRSEDLTVNPVKAKQLTNIRAAGSDENLLLTPPIKITLEFSLDFINDDELVEVTPNSIRIRKRFLKEHERKRAMRAAS